MNSFFSRYTNDLIVPLSIIAGAILLGVLFEQLVARFIYRSFERRNWRIGRRLVRSFNGIVTLWCGLAAFRSVLGELPLKASAIPVAEKITAAILIISYAVLLGRMAVAFIRTFSSEHERAVASITLIENIVRAAIYIFGLLGIFRTFGVAVTPMLTALGVGGLAVALALQDTLSNFFAGVYIILSRSLGPGDYIRLASGEEGVITDIAWRVTTLRTPLSTLIIVPNNKFSTSIITNYDRPEKSMRLVIPVTLDASTDLERFERSALAAAREVQQELQGTSPRAAAQVEPKFELLSIAPTGVSAQLVLEISDAMHQASIRHEVLKRIYQLARHEAVKSVSVPAEPNAPGEETRHASEEDE